MLADDPEAPTTINRRFNYPVFTGGSVKGSVVIDPGSVQSIDPTVPPAQAEAAPPRRQASNFLVTAPWRSASGDSQAVMGPQLGYYYPEIVQQEDLHGPGINAQGVGVPGSLHVPPDRAHTELRLEPHLGRATTSATSTPRSSASRTDRLRREPLTTTCSRVSAFPTRSPTLAP